MPTLSHIAQLDTLLDVLAIAISLIMILLLVANRLRYGHLYLNARGATGKGAFSGEMALQTMSQQSQKAYANLQQSLKREFEILQSIGGGSLPDREGDQRTLHGRPGTEPAESTGANRRHWYRMAEELMACGAKGQEIRQHCGLVESELELLEALRRFEQETCNQGVKTG